MEGRKECNAQKFPSDSKGTALLCDLPHARAELDPAAFAIIIVRWKEQLKWP